MSIAPTARRLHAAVFALVAMQQYKQAVHALR
ncbi:hypothetical protein GGR61_000464 [Xanthomonas arboricola]|nr:hypothetical protein [Xanthomonas sp. 3058]